MNGNMVQGAKTEARERALAARRGCDPAWGEALAAHVLRDFDLPPEAAAISGFWPMPAEIDVRFLLRALLGLGHRVLLPVTPRLGQPLRFRRWTPQTPMLRERFGTFCPAPESPEEIPELLFVPLVGFDRAGRRLGYGGGYYDRTLAGLPRARAVGCAFAAQELDAVPVDDYDVPLAAVATERGVIRCASS